MTPDEILFAPLADWRCLCREITDYLSRNRDPARMRYALDRLRPPGALLLEEFAERYHRNGQTKFWRVEYPHVFSIPFEFDGRIKPIDVSMGISYPGFGQVGWLNYRSIEDVNLFPNTYSHYYIFGSEEKAMLGISFLSFHQTYP